MVKNILGGTSLYFYFNVSATNCPTGENVVKCLLDPCDGATCASNPEDTTCVSNYCGGCNAVFYDYDGENVVNCTSKYLKGIGQNYHR